MITKSEAMDTVQAIAEDVFEKRGDIPADDVRRWANAYTYWADAYNALMPKESSEAIFQARMNYLEPLMSAHEDAQYEEKGDAAYGCPD